MEVKKTRLGGSIGCTAMLAAAFLGNSAAASPAVCDRRLVVELTPDVPNPVDPGFLSSLLSNQVSYRLTLLGLRPGSVIVVELSGPGPEYLCQNVVEAMRKDGRVLAIHRDQQSSPEIAVPQVGNSNTAMRTVPAGARRTTLDLRPPDLQSLHVQTPRPVATPSESDETEAVDIAAAPSRPEESADMQPPPAGIGSLYWAVRHPTQAWRILLPIQLDGNELNIERQDRAAGRATPETVTEGRDIRAKPAPATLVHDTGGNSVRRAQSGEAT